METSSHRWWLGCSWQPARRFCSCKCSSKTLYRSIAKTMVSVFLFRVFYFCFCFTSSVIAALWRRHCGYFAWTFGLVPLSEPVGQRGIHASWLKGNIPSMRMHVLVWSINSVGGGMERKGNAIQSNINRWPGAADVAALFNQADGASGQLEGRPWSHRKWTTSS